VVFPATKTTCLKSILLTHGHGDHLGGVVDILKECAARKWPVPSVHKMIVPGGNFPAEGFAATHIGNGETFSVDGATVRAIYTPGHTDDHVCFVLEVCL
jgi:glyoxylase-like metal-dependent hydrolase (beta-lactamase superfamily II)